MAVVLDSDAGVGFLDQEDALHDAADEAVRGLAREQRLLASVVAAEFRSGVASLRMPDALILATAETNTDVDLIVTGDAQASKVPGLDCAVRLLR